MRLKLLVATIPLLLSLGGCVVHFPLADNGPSLASQEEEGATVGPMNRQSTEPDTHDLAKGNRANTPDLPQ